MRALGTKRVEGSCAHGGNDTAEGCSIRVDGAVEGADIDEAIQQEVSRFEGKALLGQAF